MLEVRGVTKIYRRGTIEVVALREVSFTVGEGEIVAVVGPSGSGKTTLLNILGGLDRPTGGEVVIDGQRLSDLAGDAATAFRRRRIGFIFQFFNLLPTITALENVALPPLADGMPWRAAAARATETLAAVGMAHRAEHRPNELSGGEQQRVGIARALVMRPHLLLADEPTGNLDSAGGDQILALLRNLVAAERASVVMVTHSAAAAAIASRVLVIRDGGLGAPTDKSPNLASVGR